MILGLNEEYVVIYAGDDVPQDAFSTKFIDDDIELDLENFTYKYELGQVFQIGYTEKGKPKTEEEKIKEELEELDKTINRATEDLYELTKTTPYKSTGDVIERKKELRQQLKTIKQ